MKVIHARTNSDNLANVPITDGQIIYTKDSAEVYCDISETRYKISDIYLVNDINSSDISKFENKLYYSKSQDNLYIYDKSSDKFSRVIQLSSDDISFNDSSIEGNTVSEAITNLNNKFANYVTVENSEKGTDKKITQSVTVTSNNSDGLSLNEVKLALSDGTISNVSTLLTLAELGALPSKNASKPVMVNADIMPHNQTGFEYTIELFDLATGQMASDPISGTITAKDMMVATETDLANVQAQVNAIKGSAIFAYALDFATVFPTIAETGILTKELADEYLTNLGEKPSVGTSFLNTNTDQPTSKWVYSYYIDESIPPVVDPDTGAKTYTLKLVADGPDKINIATSETIGGIKASEDGDISVDSQGTVTLKSGSITEQKLSSELSTKISNKLDNTATVNNKPFTLSDDKYNLQISASDIQYSDDVSIQSGSMRKQTSAVIENIGVFNSDGEIIDSGKKISDISPVWVEYE